MYLPNARLCWKDIVREKERMCERGGDERKYQKEYLKALRYNRCTTVQNHYTIKRKACPF